SPREKAKSLIPPKTHKRCSHCKRWLPFDAFGRNPRTKLGLSSWCRECAREATRRWRAANSERINAAIRLGERERDCVDCGQSFTFKNARAVRCPDCRRERKLERDRRRAA